MMLLDYLSMRSGHELHPEEQDGMLPFIKSSDNDRMSFFAAAQEAMLMHTP